MKLIIVVLSLVITGAGALAEETNKLAEALEPLRPFLGTWRGEFKNSTPEKPRIDIQKWERALNGKAVRITHSINRGSYGGETMIMPHPKTSRLEFYYFTTAGFYTHGTLEINGQKMITHEEVTGNEDGITQVKGTTELLPGGKMRVKTQYLKKRSWEDGREMTYQTAPEAEVVFR